MRSNLSVKLDRNYHTKKVQKTNLQIISMNKMTLKRAIAVSMVCLVLFLICIRYSAVSYNKKIQRDVLQEKLSEITANNDAVELELKSRLNIKQLYNSATNRLGMIKLSNENVVSFDFAKSDYFKQYVDLSK